MLEKEDDVDDEVDNDDHDDEDDDDDEHEDNRAKTGDNFDSKSKKRGIVQRSIDELTTQVYN